MRGREGSPSNRIVEDLHGGRVTPKEALYDDDDDDEVLIGVSIMCWYFIMKDN